MVSIDQTLMSSTEVIQMQVHHKLMLSFGMVAQVLLYKFGKCKQVKNIHKENYRGS